MLSVFDIFKIGIGPSSSHTVGPMRIALRFLTEAREAGVLARAARVKVDLHGSLALTGVGHGTDKAAILGLLGFAPDETDPDEAEAAAARVRASKRLKLAGGPEIAFDPSKDIDLCGHIVPSVHPNEMRLTLHDAAGAALLEQTFYSVGGGFIASARQLASPAEGDRINTGRKAPFDFGSAAELLAICARENSPIDEVILRNEDAIRPRAQTLEGIDRIWRAMRDCIERGLRTGGVLPGGL
ncbi:MAG TPA: L-serine ammonia-lyase, partial [Parvularcula sp.]|nr:L-serine ammonia-lyase [Parvularcula sp.]